MNGFDYLGRFHPVLVHFPIAVLLVAVLFQWLPRRKGLKKLRKSVPALLLIGFLATVASSATGYAHAHSGDFDPVAIRIHQWLGFSSTLVSFAALMLAGRKDRESRVAYTAIVPALAVLVTLTGHTGGSITYGSDFLALPVGTQAKNSVLTSVNLDSAYLYKDIIAPLLEQKCVQCHGSKKQKGKLRLDDPQFIRKGGKHGPVALDSGKESELFERIHLPMDDEDHMPPKEKQQLTKSEIQVISFWLTTGPDFNSRLVSLSGADQLIPLLNKGSGSDNKSVQVPMPDKNALASLTEAGVALSFLEQGNGLLRANFLNVDSARLHTAIGELPKLREQLVDLRLAGSRLTAADWASIAQLTSLEKLNLQETNTGDRDMKSLLPLASLGYLNLVGTQVTASGLKQISRLKSLRRVYVYKTAVTEADRKSIQDLFPSTTVDFGNYQVPTLSSDTTRQTKPYVVPKN